MLIFLLTILVTGGLLVWAIKDNWDEPAGMTFVLVFVLLLLPLTLVVVIAQVDNITANTANEYRLRLENYSLLDDTTGDVYQYNLRNFKKEIIAFNILLAEKQQNRKSIWVR